MNEVQNKTVSVGSFKVTSGKLYLSDPCYEKKRAENNDTVVVAHKVAKGVWEATIEYNKHGRVCALIARCPTADSTFECNDVYDGGLCVDSGQMGIYDYKKFPDGETGDYDDTESFYGSVCALTQSDKMAGIVGNFGVVSMSGWGDGFYTAVVYRNEKGVAYQVMVDFHCSDEEDIEQ